MSRRVLQTYTMIIENRRLLKAQSHLIQANSGKYENTVVNVIQKAKKSTSIGITLDAGPLRLFFETIMLKNKTITEIIVKGTEVPTPNIKFCGITISIQTYIQ